MNVYINVKDNGKIDYNKNPASILKEEYFEKRYKIPLHVVKKTLLAHILKQRIIKMGEV